MEEQNQFDRVEAYLSGALSGEEKVQFEKELAGDSELRFELQMQRDMHQMMKSSSKDALRESLSSIRSEFPKEEENKKVGSNLLVKLLIGLLIAVVLIWLLSRVLAEKPSTPVEKEAQIETPKLDQEEAINTDTEIPDDLNEIPQTEPEEKRESKEETTPKQPEIKEPTKVEEKKPILYAANFDPHPILEPLMERQFRNEDEAIKLSVEIPEESKSIALEDGKANFQFKGRIEQGEVSDLGFYLFSNKETDYVDFLPIETREVVLADGRFDFMVEKEIEPGLYYYIFEDSNSGKTILIGKIRVE